MRIVRNTLAEPGRAAIGALLTVSCLVTPGVAQRPIPDALVDIGGHKLNVRQQGTSKPGVPIVVFENGFGTPLPSWTAVQKPLAADTRTVVYDRAGIGASEPGPEPRTPARIAAELPFHVTG